ncbi:MAG: rRNA adenine N-6-methyltransferase family protein [Elusimicrobiota bacterium]
MRETEKDRDFLAQIEEFFEDKVEPRFKNGFREVEKLLKKEIRLKKLKKPRLLEYDPDSPFSYLSAFLRDRAVASVAPSTKYLINRVVEAMALGGARTVVEYGPAEGVMTQRILSGLKADGVLVAVERNENFVKTLRKIGDGRLRVVHEDVQDIGRILKEQGLASVDVVVSGIPFSLFDSSERRRLLAKTSSLLSPRGRFVAYQFTTHLIPLLKRYFRKVDTQFEIRNLPPHFIFTAHV